MEQHGGEERPALDGWAAAGLVDEAAEFNAPPPNDLDLDAILEFSRHYLWTRGPSEERVLCHALGPRRTRLVARKFGSLASYLVGEPGFYHLTDGELSLLYYLDPETELPVPNAQSPKVELSGSSYGTALEDEEEHASAPAEQHGQASPTKQAHPVPAYLNPIRSRL